MERFDPLDEPDPDPLAQEEADAAAAEAAAIGGVAGDEDEDPAMRPVIEGGGGYAEGFELAEDELIEQASHGDPGGDPLADRFRPEVEADASTAAYGDPDQIDPHELVADPDVEDDPREGPGLAQER